MPHWEFICLANSRKLGGHCVAGIKTDGSGWVRPTGLPQDGLVDVRRVELASLVKAFLAQEDGDRVHLLTARATGVPDAEDRIGAEHGHHHLAQGPVEGGVAEHGGDVDGKRAQEAAVKYFLLSIFSSALLLLGFSYLYGLAGTTNLPAMAEALAVPGGGRMPGVREKRKR